MGKFFHKARRFVSWWMLVKENRAWPMEKRRTALYRAILSVYSVPTSNVRQSDWKITRSFDFFFSYFFFFHLCMIIRVYTYVCTRISSFSLFTISIPLIPTSVVSTDCKLLPNRRVASTNSPRRKTKLLSPLNAHRRAVLIESRAVYTTARYSLLIIIYRTRRCWRNLFH